MADGMGGEPLASIFATVSLDTSAATSQLNAFKPAADAASVAVDKLAAAAAKVKQPMDDGGAATKAVAAAFADYASGSAFAVQAASNMAEAQKRMNATAASALANYAGMTPAIDGATKAWMGQKASIGQTDAQLAETSRKAQAEYDAISRGAIGTGYAAQRGFGQFRASSINAGLGVLMLSQGIEDMQYGFSAVVNNIPGAVMAFGGSAGLAGGVSLAAVGFNVLMNNATAAKEVLGFPDTRDEAERMAELGKQTQKTAEETAILVKYKQQQSDLARLDASMAEKDQGDKGAVEKAIAEAQTGGRNVSGAVAGTMMQSGSFDDPAMNQKIKDLRANGLDAMANGFEEQEKGRKQEESLTAAKKLMTDALTDEASRKSLEGYVKQNPNAFAPGFLGDLERAAPAEREKQAEIERQGRDRYNALLKKAEAKKQSGSDTDSLNAASDDGERATYAGFQGQARERIAAANEALQKAREAEQKRRKDMSPAQRKADDMRNRRGGETPIRDQRVEDNIPAMPKIPDGQVGITDQQMSEMLTYLKAVSENTQKMIDGVGGRVQ